MNAIKLNKRTMLYFLPKQNPPLIWFKDWIRKLLLFQYKGFLCMPSGHTVFDYLKYQQFRWVDHFELGILGLKQWHGHSPDGRYFDFSKNRNVIYTLQMEANYHSIARIGACTMLWCIIMRRFCCCSNLSLGANYVPARRE